LRRQAVRARGAARPLARAPAADDERRRRGASVRRPGARSLDARGAPQRRVDRADAHRVLAARAVHDESAPGADEVADLRAGLGLRLRALLELARRLHRLPEAQDRGGRTAEADPDGSRRRLRAPRTVSFRTRLTLVAAAAVAFAVVVASLVVFLVVRNQLRGQVDSALKSRAGNFDHGLSIDHGFLEGGPVPLGGGDYVQLVDSHGHTIRTQFELRGGSLPPNKAALDVAKGHPGSGFSDAK